MNYLFLDTSVNLTIGILDEKFQWIDLVEIETKKTSEVIHSTIYKILSKNRLTVNSDFAIISIVGPGSYTGMRIVEGVNQIFELEGKKIYSFHTFCIPEFMKIEWTHICFMAFKNEVFLYDKNKINQLVPVEIFNHNYTLGENNKLITYGDSFKDQASAVFDIRPTFLKDPSGVLKEILKADMRHEPFYFRPVEVEFKQNS